MRSKLQKLLNKLDGKNEATLKVIADFDISVKTLRDKLEADITTATLEEVKTQIAKLRKTINLYPLLEEVKNLQTNFKENALTTLKEMEDKADELRTEIKQRDAVLNTKIDNVLKETEIIKNQFGIVAKIDRRVLDITDKLSTFADKKEVEKKIAKLEDKDNTEELKDYTDETRIELLGKIAEKGGGNMNRNISVGGNASVLSKYGDMNLIAGTNVTLSYTNNNTTRNLDLTIAATGGSGTVRSIVSTAVSSTVGAVAGTDYVTVCTAGVNVTLPTAVSNTNLYTIKNVAASSVLVSTTGGQTIDTDTELILATQFTAVDLISDSVNWNIT